MQKKINIFLALLLIVGILCGCQSQTDNNIEQLQEETEINETEGQSFNEDTVTYDQTQQYDAIVLNDGDEIIGGTYTSSNNDESVMEISGNGKATVTGSLLQKTAGDASSADASSFRGVNSAVRVYDKATLTLKDCTIKAQADNATGVFAYDNGTIYISDSTVDVTGGGAGGIQVAGGGTLYASNLNVTSKSKAAIRSDNGGGYMEVDGGTYTSLGKNGCPAIYSTADIHVSNATLISENSRAVIIEGKNSVTLKDCDLTGNDQSTKEGSIKANILLYQSASGDASAGTSAFTSEGGTITSKSGAMFYCTNTSSVINLNNTDLILSDDGSLLIVSEGRWGKDGKNGGNCVVNAVNQTLEGSIQVDSISSLELNLSGSAFTGSIENKGKTSVILDSSSTWTLTADSYVTSFTGDASNVIGNGYKLYVNGTALSGTK